MGEEMLRGLDRDLEAGVDRPRPPRQERRRDGRIPGVANSSGWTAGERDQAARRT
jgi:hypothetical protein